MRRLVVTLAICLFPIFSACAPVTNILPFGSSPKGNINTPFAGIEVPAALSAGKNGYIDNGTDGMPTGLATYSGYISPTNLQSEMNRLMLAQGWKLHSAAGTNRKMISVYQNNSRYAVLVIQELTAAGTELDVWVAPTASNGILPLPYMPNPSPREQAEQAAGANGLNTAPIAPPAAHPAEQKSQPSGGMQERSL
jgi:hypothetical protein